MFKKLVTVKLFIFVCCFAADVFAQTENAGLRKINGTSLFVSAKGSGDPLIVIHGGPGLNHSYFIQFLQNLEKK